MRTFTFNRPITLLFCLPLLVLIAMFVYGLTVEFRVMLVVMLLFSLGVVGGLVYFGMLRRVRLGNGQAEWRTPMKQLSMPLAEVRHYGIVKFRSFRFIYFSRCATDPFADGERAVVTDADTFVLQYRPAAWAAIEKAILALHPNLKPATFVRQ